MRTIDALIEDAFQKQRDGNWAAAAEIYDTVIGYTDATNLTALHQMAGIMGRDGYYGVSLALNYRVLANAPQHVEGWANVGMCLNRLHRMKAAEAAYKEGLRLDPENEAVLANYSGLLVNQGRSDELVEVARECVRLHPNNPHGQQHLALGLLEQGRYSDAWEHYAWRWQVPEMAKNRRPYTAPLWDGKRVGTLAIHGEQGLGDEILFMSCLSRVARKGIDRIAVEAATRLVRTFAEAFGLSVFSNHADLVAALGHQPDAYVPMGSLPGLVGLPDGHAFLPRLARRGNGRPRVGIAWRGGTDKTHKRARSLRLAQLAPILAISGIDFVSVQYGDGGEVEEARNAGLVGALGERNIGRDFEAAQESIGGCDLIITVQQTAVHQAGAMGVPCWVLTPKATSWQFTEAHGDRMVWYDSVRLFRQGDDREWAPVIERIAAELRSQYAVAA